MRNVFNINICSSLFLGDQDQMRMPVDFGLVNFMETKGPNESNRIFCSYIFHGDQRTKSD
jgi:hypothetical protein